jgi:type IV pilus assembly protein PilV
MEYPNTFPAKDCHRRQSIDRISRATHAGGFSLVEVLVSIVVMTFGMLGMVGMQAAALKANREARIQSSAINLAKELADMIRGNKAIGILTTNNPYLGDFNSVPLAAASPSYCLSVRSSATCTDGTAVANSQMTEWLARIDAELPGARVMTCRDNSPYDSDGLPEWTCTSGADEVVVIKIGWTRGSTDRSRTGGSAFENVGDTGSRPSIILPVTPGV